MRFLIKLTALFFAFVLTVPAQTASDVSVADAARQSKAHSSAAKRVYDDQNGEFGRSGEDTSTPCGATIASLESGSVSALMGKTPDDDDVAKTLVKWLDKHPELDVMHPEDIAKIEFPRSMGQSDGNKARAMAVATEFEKHLAAGADLKTLVMTPYSSGAESVILMAIRNEQQRRVQSDGSPEDRLKEAVNLYSICENRRIQQFDPEIDQMAKQELKNRLTTPKDSATKDAAQGK